MRNNGRLRYDIELNRALSAGMDTYRGHYSAQRVTKDALEFYFAHLEQQRSKGNINDNNKES